MTSRVSLQPLRQTLLGVALAAVTVFAEPAARAVLFYETADASHNTTAPTGTYTDSGWQYQGLFGGFLGTAIGENYFITATHVGTQSSSFVQTALFTGGVPVSYNINTGAFGGNGFYDIPGTDLRIYQTIESFSTWAPLYEGSLEAGMTAVVTGRGGARGSAVTLDTGMGNELKGWVALNPDGTTRWGTNVISAVVPDALSDVGPLLRMEFNAVLGTEEAMLSSGDSGGAVFVNDGGIWKLAGINYAIDGNFNTSPSDAGAFSAALLDKDGFYEGSGATWIFNGEDMVDTPSSFYASQISPYAGTINGIVTAPEPGSALLATAALLLFARRRRQPTEG